MGSIGYARVSREEQNLNLQLDALHAAGCLPHDIYTDHGVSGKTTSRPQLDRCLDALREGDVLVVWKLDRLGRSLRHLVNVVMDLRDRGIEFKSLTEGMDTSTNQGRMVFAIFAGLADFERGLIVERTMAGLAAAKGRGHVGGRQPVINAQQARMAKRLIAEGATIADVAGVMKVSRPTIYRVIEMTDRELAARDDRAAARLRQPARATRRQR